jgi:hypothetical protein
MKNSDQSLCNAGACLDFDPRSVFEVSSEELAHGVMGFLVGHDVPEIAEPLEKPGRAQHLLKPCPPIAQRKMDRGPRNHLRIQLRAPAFRISSSSLGFMMVRRSATCPGASKNVEWVTDCIKYMREKGYERIAASEQAQESVDRSRQRTGRRHALVANCFMVF